MKLWILWHRHDSMRNEPPLGAYLTETGARLARLRVIEERTPTGDPAKRAKWERELKIEQLTLDFQGCLRDLWDPLRGIDVPRPRLFSGWKGKA
jgi:hypothetical protein